MEKAITRLLVKVFSDLMISNSSYLLRAIGTIGISTAMISFFLGIVIIFKKLAFGVSVTGWSSIMVAILLFGGMILFTLGITGEYLIRIIATSERRPVYFVRNVIKKEAGKRDK